MKMLEKEYKIRKQEMFGKFQLTSPKLFIFEQSGMYFWEQLFDFSVT